MAPVTVAYVAGYERSGSTIFQNVIGQSSGLWAAGEVREIWHRGLMQNRPCGCGADTLWECPFWEDVLTTAFGSLDAVRPEHWYTYRRRTRNRHFPALFLPGGPALLKRRLDDYPDALESLYRAIGTCSGGKVVVDTSKSPTHAWLLNELPGVNVRLIHLTRDPRGVANSFYKRMVSDDHVGYQDYSIRRAALEWRLTNGMIEQLTRRFSIPSLHVRYEDFTADPERVVNRVTRWLGAEPDTNFVEGQSVTLHKTHTVVGSPHRFTTGTIELRRDDAWRSNLPDDARSTVERWTGRARRSYAY